MIMGDRLNLIVSPGVGDLLTALAGGERRRGEWLSKMVTSLHEQNTNAQASDLDQLRFAVTGVIGQTKMLETRLFQVERNLAAMIAKTG